MVLIAYNSYLTNAQYSLRAVWTPEGGRRDFWGLGVNYEVEGGSESICYWKPVAPVGEHTQKASYFLPGELKIPIYTSNQYLSH